MAAMLLALVCLAAGALASTASAHPERPVAYPSPPAKPPDIRRSGPARVVCKRDSRRRIRRIRGSVRNRRIRLRNLRYLKRCRSLLQMLFYAAEPPPYSEIAAALGTSEGSIGPTRARCLKKLLDALKKKGFS